MFVAVDAFKGGINVKHAVDYGRFELSFDGKKYLLFDGDKGKRFNTLEEVINDGMSLWYPGQRIGLLKALLKAVVAPEHVTIVQRAFMCEVSSVLRGIQVLYSRLADVTVNIQELAKVAHNLREYLEGDDSK